MSNVMRSSGRMAERTLAASYFALLAVLFAPGLACAQKMEQPAQGYAAGDRFTFKWVLDNKPQIMEQEWGAGTDDEMQGVDKIAGKELMVTLARSDFSARQRMCLANGQPCTMTPGLEFVKFPLEKGKQWTTTVTVKGETFTAEVTQERKVEGIEKVKVPAGEFDAFKVSYTGRIKGTDNKGKAFTGKEEGSDWLALIGGKLAIVKLVYRNSFNDKAMRELISTSLR